MSSTNAADTIRQLDQARKLCLADPNNLYPQIVPGLAPIINATAELDLRRWGTDFLAETFASPVLLAEHKQKLAIQVLEGLKGYLDKADEDPLVVKSVVQTAASIYQYVVRHMLSQVKDSAAWQLMSSIKSSILRRMDSAPAGVRLCCIKFVQRVVQVQTPGTIADPRRPEQNETSLALVPRDHPVIPYSNLEAEASGLLDRLLDILQDSSNDVLLVTATINSLSALVRTRASISNKIVSTLLSFNPFTLAQAQSPISIKNKVLIRSLTKTLMSFLANIIKKNQNHPLAPRIHGTLDRLRQSLIEVLDETRRKRPALEEPTDGLSEAKRQRVEASIDAGTSASPAFAADGGLNSFAQLFTLTTDESARGFDVKLIPLDLVSRIVPPLLASIDANKLNQAINAVRARYLQLAQSQPRPVAGIVNQVVGPSADEDDDYTPDVTAETKEQVLNQLDQSGSVQQPAVQPPELALGPFHLPQPPALTEETAAQVSKGLVRRVFGTLGQLDRQAPPAARIGGLHRTNATSHDRNAWVLMLARIATRSSSGLDDDKQTSQALTRQRFLPADAIRDTLYLYIVEDFRRRIDVAIAWLNEEWYSDQISRQQFEVDATAMNGSSDRQRPTNHYDIWLSKLVDGFLPFLDAKDRLLIRFLSEIPALDSSLIKRVVKLAADPDRVNLAIQALHYLILYRPPVKEICLDGVEDLFKNYEDARNPAQKLLVRFRPHVVEQAGVNGHAPVKVEA